MLKVKPIDIAHSRLKILNRLPKPKKNNFRLLNNVFIYLETVEQSLFEISQANIIGFIRVGVE